METIMNQSCKRTFVLTMESIFIQRSIKTLVAICHSINYFSHTINATFQNLCEIQKIQFYSSYLHVKGVACSLI